MKQIIQNLKTGETKLEETPSPQIKDGNILLRTSRSLVSLGTERMLVEFSNANLLNKAKQQPDKVKQVKDKIRTEGLMPTINSVLNRLEDPLPLGYCNVGEVIDIGKGVTGFKIGDRVASNGPHAEIVCVPQNLAAKIPDNVSNDEAAFTVIGSIGLQGIRLFNPTIGETVVVIGLGLIGLITSQLLLANGCRVIGIDIDPDKLSVAESKGITTFNSLEDNDPVTFVEKITDKIGADGVIITASAKNNEIISQAARMSRKRGRIVLVGVVGLDLNRAEFYQKELSFSVSCSYGPGRYDENYEQKGIDYPLPFVRWTEKRNFETILQTIATGRLDVKSLITEKVELKDYQKIYNNIGNSKSIASLLIYSDNSSNKTNIEISSKSFKLGSGAIGIIGAGNFTKMTMMPFLSKINAPLKYIASSTGVTGTFLAKKYNIQNSTTDYNNILNDPEVDLVMITTRHNSHARIITEALNSGKNVFVEKPLALTEIDLKCIAEAYINSGKTLTVGYNRRFSPFIIKIKELLGNDTSPINVTATMNAGFIPQNSWVHDPEIGGGRIIGEACHYLDLLTFLTGSRIISVQANSFGLNYDDRTDNISILLKFENGSNGVVNYFSNGSKAYSKERLEVYSQNRTLILDNFKELYGYGFKSFTKLKGKRDSGHYNQFKLLIERLKNGGDPLIPADQIFNVAKATFAIMNSLQTNSIISINNAE